MNTVVITPTKRWGGLGEQFLTLANQLPKQDFAWLVADDLYEERHEEFKAITDKAPFHVEHFLPMPKPPGYWSNLAGIYNELLDRAVEMRAHVIISLQDYIVLRPGAVKQMAADVLSTRGLVTGLVSYTNHPTVDRVTDPEGKITIFDTVYEDWDIDDLYWEDVRKAHYPPDEITGMNAVDWELNWAGIPGEIVRAGLRFDEKYGEGIGHENQDFAWQALLQFDRPTYINPQNQALSLPHQLYWPEEREEYVKMSGVSKEIHDKKYESVLTVFTGGRT